jgi:inorganic triphosphatase YgiF
MEVEAKFQLLDPDVVDIHRLKALFEQGGYAVEGTSEPIHIIDVYFDRKDHGLRRAGAAVRVRKKNQRVLLTYKRKIAQEGELHSRIELEAEPTLEHLKEIYKELKSLDSIPNKDQPQPTSAMMLEDTLETWGLVPMLEIGTKRYKVEVGFGGQTLAFVVLDRVQFELCTREGGYSGIEIEALEDKDAQTVVALSEVLKAELGEDIKAQEISKYEFALQHLGDIK